MLEQNSYRVHAFNSPTEAVEHVNEKSCKACSTVISDVRVPGMSGFELVPQLKDIRPEIRVILMTAFKMNKAEAQIVLPSTKVNAFLNKPFKQFELIDFSQSFLLKIFSTLPL